MLKEQFLVLLLTFAVSRSFCDDENGLGTGESFIELELFQEIMLQYFSWSCRHNCWDIVSRGLCNIEPCIGGVPRDCEITSCAWLGHAKACASREGDHKVQWVSAKREDELYRYGKNHDNCSEEEGFEMYHIEDPNVVGDYSNCHCHCFKHHWKIYLGELKSRESENYVITGIRFKLQDKILFLQPAEGKVETDGKIIEHRWVPLPNDPSELGEISLDSRNFFFDDLLLEPTHVLTGIMFEFMEIVDPENIKGFAITISGVPFDDEAGKLDLAPENRQIVKPELSTPRKRLLFKSVNPFDTKTSNIHKPSPEEYNYVELQQSSLKDDFGQSTLPLFNSSPVAVDQLSPLEGIGIFHEGSGYHAGFISLRLYSIN